ncbi:MAG TPA: hydrogenase maturation nickel metallochaperone HypA [Ktedonobacteraceae bacterium]|nr:hydrogenase maturation nickel metallochaperone HypA [Ktedonobacteraceae bacterium]
MHETFAMQGIVHTVLECMRKAGGLRVTNVQLVLGASGHLTADVVYQHFKALTKDTPAENASLTIQWLPATYKCFSCLYRFESCEPCEQVACPKCGDVALEISHHDVCYVSAIDITGGEEHEKVNELVLPAEESEAGSHVLSSLYAVPSSREGSFC